MGLVGRFGRGKATIGLVRDMQHGGAIKRYCDLALPRRNSVSATGGPVTGISVDAEVQDVASRDGAKGSACANGGALRSLSESWSREWSIGQAMPISASSKRIARSWDGE